MKNLFLVAPYHSDSLFQKKKSTIIELCSEYNIRLQTAEDNKLGNSLNVVETVKMLENCDFAIADLSFERPSCYFEIGYLQALKKSTYLICMSESLLHQVLQVEKTFKYSNLKDYKIIVNEILKREISNVRY